MLAKRRMSHVQGYLALGMVAEAAEELDRITGPEGRTPEVLALRLAVLHEQQRWPELRDVASELVKYTPQESGLWITWAYATRRADSLAAAENILSEAERLHPTEPTIQFNLGCYACQRGDLKNARLRVEHAIALDEKFAGLAASDSDLAPLRESGWRAP